MKLIPIVFFISATVLAQSSSGLWQYGNKFYDAVGVKAIPTMRGKVQWVKDGIVGFETEKATSEIAVSSSVVPTDYEPDTLIAITNFPDISNATVNKWGQYKMVKIGIYDGYENQPIELYDCGKPYIPPPPTSEQIKAAQAAAQLRAARDRQRYLIGETNTVRFLLTEATNGDASAQCSLGEHYLAGLGCETNHDLAIQWLQKAADGGSTEASNKLAQLKSP